MAQFDIHRNRGPRRDDIPFVVIVQSSRFDGSRRRVVVPLVLRAVVGAVDPGPGRVSGSIGRGL